MSGEPMPPVVTVCPRCHLPWRRPYHVSGRTPCDRCKNRKKGLRMSHVEHNRSPEDEDWTGNSVRREDY